MPKRKPLPILRSLPITEKLDLPPRAELLAKIESGELDHLDFKARVFRTDTKIRNPYVFKTEDLENFASSFEGQLFLRNHDTHDIDARDGTIIESELVGSAFKQTIRLTTRRGMTDFVEGKIDRFSIGWDYDDAICSICKNSFFSRDCTHWPGQKYKVNETKEEVCKLIFVNPTGKETSAVNTPAVDGTGIDALQEYKLEVFGDVTAVTHARRASKSTSMKGVKTMPRKVTTPAAVLDIDDEEEFVNDEQRAALELQNSNEIIAQMQADQKQQREIHLANLSALLENSLAGSKLPTASQKAVRKPFETKLAAGETFLPTELKEAINDKREELAALSESMIEGPGRPQISGMANSKDQFRLAVEDLFGLERSAEEANIKVHKLRGIQDAYLMATGDQSFMGGYYPEFALVTANFPGIVANVMNKMLTKAWADFKGVYGWWDKIVTIEHFNNLNDVSWVRTGTIASLPTVAERGEYTELPIGDIRETSAWGKYGGYVPLTIEAVLRDDLRAFTRMPREAALAGIRNISEQVAAIFTQSSGAGPTMADGGALFNATAQTTAGGHINLLTTALGTDYTAWNAVVTAMMKKKLMVKNASGYYGTGKPQGLKPTICLVPPDLAAQADALFIPRHASNTEAIQPAGLPTYGAKVDPVTVIDWTDANDWAAVIDPKLRPGVMIGEIFGVKPQIFSASSEIDPAMFANDESRIKVRQFLTVGVADDMPLHKNNVT